MKGNYNFYIYCYKAALMEKTIKTLIVEPLKPCYFIDDTHMRIGETVFRPLQVAERQERAGSIYAPLHPKWDDICDT